MRGTIVTWERAVSVLALAAVVGCGTGEAKTLEGGEGVGPGPASGAAAVAPEAGAPGSFVEREFWLAIADEPGWHLDQARQDFLAGDARSASEELSKVAAMLNFELRHGQGDETRGKMMASVEELREVARQTRFQSVPFEGVPDVRELDRVSALTFRALGLHHEALARRSLGEGDALMAGLYMLESADDVERGFARAGGDMDAVMAKDLAEARGLAKGMAVEGSGTPAGAEAALGRLDDAVRGLGQILGSRRR